MKTYIFLLAVFGAATAVPQRTQRIVGGEPTTIERYPYMSNMMYGWFGIIWFQSCGGALITTFTSLSAAHCFFGDQPSSWRVRLGSSFPDSGGIVYDVSQLIIHAGYSPATIDNDVAIVRTATPAILSPSVGIARIAGGNYILPDHTPVTSIGWGALWAGGPSPDVLQHVEVRTINQELCAERYAHLKTLPGFATWPDITPGMLCAGVLGEGGKDACQGDSGGPLAHEGDVLCGVTSWGYSCANGTYPGVNARVSHYSSWIAENGST